MKKLLLAVAVLFATSAFAQSKGETQLNLGGSLFESEKGNFSGAESVTTIDPAVGIRYLMTDKIGIDGIVAFNKVTDGDAGFWIGAGGRYYWYSQDKMRVNSGVDALFGLGNGAKRLNEDGDATSPLDVSITLAELEYWPMEGGALYVDGFFDLNGLNLGDAGSKGFGLGLGVKIRIK